MNRPDEAYLSNLLHAFFLNITMNDIKSLMTSRFHIMDYVIVLLTVFSVLSFYSFVFDLTSVVSSGNPQTAPVITGQDCEIEINKGDVGLGLSIVGGSDTVLVSDSTTLIRHAHA